MDNTKQSPLTTISIGPGIRGIERGIESTGTRLNHIAYVEIEPFIIENLVAEMEQGLLDPAVIWSDGKTFPSHLFRGKVNLLLAGYPCQPFSNAGKRKGADDPRHLWPHIERTIDIIRPYICFFENVRGHITLGLREVIESLEGLGYSVHWGIFSAEETGASHKRERVFIMAVRKDILDNSSGNGLESHNSIPTGRNSAEPAGSPELANPEHHGLNEPKNRESTPEGNNGNKTRTQPAQQSQGCSSEPAGYNEELAKWDDEKLSNSNGKRCERIKSSHKSITELHISTFRNRNIARPGQPQHEWECPRTTTGQWETKSCVGGSIDGYKFREDFLRALGNSVYPPTAALAWRTLSEKHQLKI